MGNTNYTWYILQVRHKGVKVDLGEMGSECNQGTLFEVPK